MDAEIVYICFWGIYIPNARKTQTIMYIWTYDDKILDHECKTSRLQACVSLVSYYCVVSFKSKPVTCILHLVTTLTVLISRNELLWEISNILTKCFQWRSVERKEIHKYEHFQAMGHRF